MKHSMTAGGGTEGRDRGIVHGRINQDALGQNGRAALDRERQRERERKREKERESGQEKERDIFRER